MTNPTVPDHGTYPWLDAYTSKGGEIQERCWPILAEVVGDVIAERDRMHQIADEATSALLRLSFRKGEPLRRRFMDAAVDQHDWPSSDWPADVDQMGPARDLSAPLPAQNGEAVPTRVPDRAVLVARLTTEITDLVSTILREELR